MEKEFIAYSEALALKELGFDEPCRDHWERGTDGLGWGLFTSGEWLTNKELMTEYKDDEGNICGEFLAPLYQQAFRWLWNKTGKYIIPIQNDDKEWLATGIVYKTYEEAELECLKKLIELAKNK